MKATEEIKQIISEIDQLISSMCKDDDLKFQMWLKKAKSFIVQKFGQDNHEYTKFENIQFHKFDVYIYPYSGTSIDQVAVCKNGLLEAKSMFLKYLEYFENNPVVKDDEYPNGIPQQFNFKKIFIVHGHDGELKESVARIIEKQGIEAIILSEQANQGKTIIEKFEENSEVGGAICLFTQDDLGKAKAEKEEQFRARQNVVFEAGYFMGKLGREHIVILADKNVEMPSDLLGVVYTNTSNWQIELLKELSNMGYQIDANKLIK